jgi:hypothetical protein
VIGYLQIAPGQVQIGLNSLRAHTAPAQITATRLPDSAEGNFAFDSSIVPDRAGRFVLKQPSFEALMPLPLGGAANDPIL